LIFYREGREGREEIGHFIVLRILRGKMDRIGFGAANRRKGRTNRRKEYGFAAPRLCG
jgi:hypothetical protein